ncbi:hypothetical protein ACNONS_26000 [Bacteroides xylanisolvens]|jgi:hypothetical protein|uniref:hypothetical protein n=1 Tax=Bacteroides TaxID=816 RepID=UPI0025400D7C|nr:hypothetical protein [Bacteroides sp. AM54-2NS]
MIRTKVKLHLKDEGGDVDTITTWINLPEQQAHDHYIGKRLNLGTVADRMMKCFKVETLNIQDVNTKGTMNAVPIIK